MVSRPLLNNPELNNKFLIKENNMKGLKKLALVSAIAVAPFAAQAELQAMNDVAMGDVTGQAGVTIEMQTQIDIGQFRYTDEGSFAVNTIKLGGANGLIPGSGTSGALLDGFYIDIDVEATGDAVISLHTTEAGKAIDWGFSFANAQLIGSDGTMNVLENFSAIGYLAQLDIRVDVATNDLIVDVGFSVENLNVDVPFLAVGVRGLTVHGANYTNAATPGANMAYAGPGVGPVGLERFAFARVVMGTDTASAPGAPAGDVLRIDIPIFAADVNISQLLVGGVNIGSVKFDNLVISNTSMKVYGHN
jgi:hypothetical protein